MTLERLPYALSVCKIAGAGALSRPYSFFFAARTDKELSLVCRTEEVPPGTIAREDGWRAFRVAGTLDFSLVGILSRITGLLADGGIGLFAVSTYDTDYVLVRDADFARAAEAGFLRVVGFIPRSLPQRGLLFPPSSRRVPSGAGSGVV